MRRLNDYKFYELGIQLKPLEDMPNEAQYKDTFFELFTAREAVIALLDNYPLSICRGPADELIRTITAVVPVVFKDALAVDKESELGFRAYYIRKAKEAFENVLSAAMNELDTYLLTQQGIYKTADLVDHADLAFSDSTRASITDEARNDFRQGGRCIAFELPTASGFHTMRATEAVLRQYHRLVMALAPGAKSPEMAQCINELRSKGEDPKVMNILDSIRDLHRNPQMHPEAFLSMDEAVRLFDISKSAINAMADRVAALTPKQQPVTSGLTITPLPAPLAAALAIIAPPAPAATPINSAPGVTSPNP